MSAPNARVWTKKKTCTASAERPMILHSKIDFAKIDKCLLRSNKTRLTITVVFFFVNVNAFILGFTFAAIYADNGFMEVRGNFLLDLLLLVGF